MFLCLTYSLTDDTPKLSFTRSITRKNFFLNKLQECDGGYFSDSQMKMVKVKVKTKFSRMAITSFVKTYNVKKLLISYCLWSFIIIQPSNITDKVNDLAQSLS